jgi:hypothetical protein
MSADVGVLDDALNLLAPILSSLLSVIPGTPTNNFSWNCLSKYARVAFETVVSGVKARNHSNSFVCYIFVLGFIGSWREVAFLNH